MTFSSDRRFFRKELLKALAPELKGSRWKKKQNSIYCEVNGYFFDVFINVYLNDSKTGLRMSAKPMSLDNLYWKITNLDENCSEPLSFRSWGAFICSGLPLVEKPFADEGVSAQGFATQVVEWANSELEAALPKLKAEVFSNTVAGHPNQVERGAYAITFVTSLIAEGNLGTARQAAAAYADGSVQSVSKHSHIGRDFHEIAVEWIDSKVSAS